MEILGARPVWSMSDSEKLSALDAVVAEEARLKTLRWQLTTSLDQSGYAQDLGSGDTARLLSERYRQDLRDARRDVRVANRLVAYTATSEALPVPSNPFPNAAHATDASPATDGTDGDGDSSVTGHDDAEDGWRVSPDQAAAIIGILDRVPPSVPQENLDVAEQQLIGLAATHTPEQLRSAGRVIRDLLDPDGAEPDEKAAYARESLTLKAADRGLTFKGYLANENAELFRTLIHAHSRPQRTADGDLDPRPHSKRQADALTTILTATGQSNTTSSNTTQSNATPDTAQHDATSDATQSGAIPGATQSHGTSDPTPSGGRSSSDGAKASLYGDVLPFPSDRPTGRGASIGASTDAATGASAEAGTDASAGAGVGAGAGGEVPGHGVKPHISVTIDYNDLRTTPANATGALVFGDNLSAATVRRLACDAEILPIVLGSKSQPLDVGTSQRLVTRPMRRALNARDKGCVVCGAPPIQCEAHHIIHWADGGITAVSNLALLCKRHHIDLHSGHWQVRILGGVVHVTRPAWADPARIPPGRYQPPTANITHQPLTPPPSPRAPRSDDPLAQRPMPLHPLDPAPWANDPPPARPTKATAPTPIDPDPWGDNSLPARSTARTDAPPSAPTTPDTDGSNLVRQTPGSQAPTAANPWSDDEPPHPPQATWPTPSDPWFADDAPTPFQPLPTTAAADPSDDQSPDHFTNASVPTDAWGNGDVPGPLQHPSSTVVRDAWGDDVPA